MTAKYILEVQADPSGLTALKTEFQRLDATIQSTAKTAAAAMLGLGKGGATELSKMRSELDQATAGIRTLQAENEKLTKMIESGAARRSGAVKADADAHVKAYNDATLKVARLHDQAAAEDRKRAAKRLQEAGATAAGVVDAESRVTQLILADKVKLAGEMRKLAQSSAAERHRLHVAGAEAETRATQMILAAELASSRRKEQESQRLAATMRQLATQRNIDNANALAKEVADNAKAVDKMIAERQKLRAIDQGNTLGLINNSVGVGARSYQKEQAEGWRLLNQQFDANAKAAAAVAAQQAKLSGAKNAVTTAAKAQAESMRELHHGMRGLAGGVGQLWMTYGSLLPLLSGFAVSAGIRKALELGSEFQYQTKFAGIVADASAEQLATMSTEYMRLGETSAFSSTEVARGARTLAQAGFSTADSLKVLPDLLKFSTLGEIELAQGAEIAAGMMHAFGLSVQDVPHILNSTARAAQLSQTTIGEMGQALRQSSSVAQQYNISIDEMNALLAVLAERNIRGGTAGTALRNMLMELDPHTERAQRAFKTLGINVYDASGNMKPIIPLMREFALRFAEFDKQSQNRLASDYFNERGAKAFLTAIAGNSSALDEMFRKIKDGEGTLDRQADKLNQTFAIQGKQALNVFQNALIEAFQDNEPVLVDIVKSLRTLAEDPSIRSGLSGLVSLFGSMAHATLAMVGAVSQLIKLIPQIPGVKTISSAVGDFHSGATQMWGDTWDRLFGADPTALSSQSDMDAATQARLRRSRQEYRRDLDAGALRSFRQMEAANLSTGGALGYGNANRATTGGRTYDRGAAEKAAREDADIAAMKYRQEETAARDHYNAQMTMLRAYRESRLITETEYQAREDQITAAYLASESARTGAIVASLEAQRSAITDKKALAKVDLEIVKARENFSKASLAVEAASIKHAVGQWKDYNSVGESVLESARKKNEELRGEIELLQKGQGLRKDEIDAKIQGRIRTEEETLARLQNAEAALAQIETVDANRQAALYEIQVIRDRIAALKKEQADRRTLMEERKQLESDWLVGARQGLTNYLDHAGSVASAMSNAFKQAFGTLEDAIVAFVTTGKFSFKDFAKSVIADLVRLVAQLTITIPLARALRAALGGGGSVGNVSLSGGGGSGGFGADSLSSYGMLAQGGAWLGGATGLMTGASAYAAAVPGLAATGAGSQAAMLAAQTGVFGSAGTAATVAAGSTATGVGGLSTAMSGIYSTLAAIPVWGWIAMAVVAIGAWIAGSHKGGPKVGGSFMGTFDSGPNFQGGSLDPAYLAVAGTDNGRFFTPDQGDAQMRLAVQAVGGSFWEALKMLGGKADGVSFGLGFDHDPNGTQQSRVSSSAYVGGREVYRVRDRGMDDKEVEGALGLEAQRMVLAALQNSELPEAIDIILETVEAATASAEQVQGVLALASAFKQLTESFTDISVNGVLEDARKTQLDRVREQASALTQLAGQTNLTVGSLNSLQNATAQFRQNIADLIVEFENAKTGIDSMFSNTARDIRLSVMDDPEKYAFYQTEANQAFDAALASNDVAYIQRQAQLINDDINSAFGMLSPEEQRARAEEYLERIEMVNERIQQRISQLQNEAQNEFNSTVDKLTEAVDKIVEDFSKAAATQLEAAQTPVQVGIDVEVFDSRATATVITGD